MEVLQKLQFLEWPLFAGSKKVRLILLDVHQYNIKKYAYNQGSCSFALYS